MLPLQPAYVKVSSAAYEDFPPLRSYYVLHMYYVFLGVLSFFFEMGITPLGVLSWCSTCVLSSVFMFKRMCIRQESIILFWPILNAQSRENTRAISHQSPHQKKKSQQNSGKVVSLWHLYSSIS
jgi:hypothetical protein